VVDHDDQLGVVGQQPQRHLKYVPRGIAVVNVVTGWTDAVVVDDLENRVCVHQRTVDPPDIWAVQEGSDAKIVPDGHRVDQLLQRGFVLHFGHTEEIRPCAVEHQINHSGQVRELG
jgi:hypothetical protein